MELQILVIIPLEFEEIYLFDYSLLKLRPKKLNGTYF